VAAMADNERDMSTAPPPAPAKKRGRARWFLLALLVLLLGGGAAGGAWWWKSRAQAADAAHAGPETIGEHSGVLRLEQFTVNLADREASRFLRVSVHLVVSDGSEIEALQKHELKVMRVRSAVLELLTVQTSDRVVTPEGKAALKQAIAARTSAILTPVKVIDVLFSDFVVQF